MFNESLGPAVAQFAQQIQSMFAGFSEGPIIGSLGAIATAAGFFREAIVGSAQGFHDLGLEAEKAGVSVEFMDRFANVASTVGVNLDQAGLAFKILEQRAEEAQQQVGGKASVAFQKLGIDSAELARLLEDPEQMMTRVMAGMNGLSSAADAIPKLKNCWAARGQT